MATATLLTLEQFSALPEFDERTGSSFELDHGELIIVSPQSWEHENLKAKLFLLLSRYFEERGLRRRAVIEAGFVLDEESWRKPDVAVMSEEALLEANGDPKRPLEGAPELAVEIASPSDTSAMIGRKVDHFLAAGSKTVWVFYPESRQVHVHKVGRKTAKLGRDQHLEEPEILPGFRFAISQIFE
ncbi:MAG TPA: Uma2 family endonuclease [Bryobacteraceae bacterium]|nr:Uma2 family endonuclease [Bryobacteraceae bacterium]